MTKEDPVEKENARKEVFSQLKTINENLLEQYKALDSFILKLQKSNAFKEEDASLVKDLCQEYKDHLQNLKVLKEELAEHRSDEELEAPILMETSEAVLNKALTFMLSIPKALSKTEIGKDIPFEDFSDIIHSKIL